MSSTGKKRAPVSARISEGREVEGKRDVVATTLDSEAGRGVPSRNRGRPRLLLGWHAAATIPALTGRNAARLPNTLILAPHVGQGGRDVIDASTYLPCRGGRRDGRGGRRALRPRAEEGRHAQVRAARRPQDPRPRVDHRLHHAEPRLHD